MLDMNVVDLGESLQQVVLSGRLDSASVAGLEARFTATLGAPKDAIIDLTAVEFCGSLAIRMFLAAGRIVQKRDRRMVIAGAQPQVKEVFDTVALSAIIPLAATPAEARKQLGA
jgi:anti-anti-sigma factor